ncbi:gluconokinase [Emticicia sp. TH156]|uniref:gluconokinase n=1 Tax=Emticicia sp. TH156 TaxID=2067454 RepID=UPI000C762D47|nr:gluconokinase [Emticicia sp. TH156]PLK46201.1 carbohydrate kinase [Emticicia sp. TH156]
MTNTVTEYFIGIDVGTTTTKAVVFDRAGNVLNQYSSGYGMTHPKANWSEQNPDEIYEAFKEALNVVVTPAIAEKCIISFSSAMHGLIAVDESGKPLTNLILWADNRATDLAAQLKPTETGQEIYHRTGIPIHPFSVFSKILWLKENEPDVYRRTHQFIGIKEYLWFRLFGDYTIDYSLASGSGLFNCKEMAWDSMALSILGISETQLPALVATTHIRRNESNPSLPLVNYVIGAGDGPLANLGSGAMKPGQMAFTMGTSGAVRMCVPLPYTDPQMRTFNFYLSENQYIIGGATNNGGIVLQWLEEQILISKNTKAQLIAEAQKLETGSADLLFLPYILGERAPVWNAEAKGVFFGLSITHKQAHLVRAVMEGLILNVYSIGKILMEQQPVNEIFASGGFAKSDFWLQLVADIFQKKVVVCETVEGSAWGAALLAMQALGITEEAGGTAEGKVFLPDTGAGEKYQRIHEKFERLYDKLKDEF